MEQEKLLVLGGATHPRSIGQQCSVVDTMAGGKLYRVMIDCGTEFFREDDLGMGGIGPIPDFSLLSDGKKVDAVFLSHLHNDHISAIGDFCSTDYILPDARVYCSPQTGAVLPTVMKNKMKNDLQFGVFDAAEVLNRVSVIEKPGEFEILPGLKVYISQRGHLPGNGGIVIPLASGKKGLFTSDECWYDQPIIERSTLPSEGWPQEWLPDEIWGTDLTYGPAGNGKPKPTIDEEVARLIETVREALASDKKVIIASFAVGRTQNIAIWLSRAGIPVYLDGTGRYIYGIFQKNRWTERDNELPELGEKSQIFTIENQEHREDIIKSEEPCVVITTGGMGDFGPIISYFEEGISRNDFVFIFTSWLAPGTNGKKLVNVRKKGSRGSVNVRLKMGRDGFKNLTLKSSVEHFGISGHSPMEKTVDFLDDLVSCRSKNLDRVVLTHGTEDNKITAAHMFRPYSKQIIPGEKNSFFLL